MPITPATIPLHPSKDPCPEDEFADIDPGLLDLPPDEDIEQDLSAHL